MQSPLFGLLCKRQPTSLLKPFHPFAHFLKVKIVLWMPSSADNGCNVKAELNEKERRSQCVTQAVKTICWNVGTSEN